jgi:hypothetical protein
VKVKGLLICAALGCGLAAEAQVSSYVLFRNQDFEQTGAGTFNATGFFTAERIEATTGNSIVAGTASGPTSGPDTLSQEPVTIVTDPSDWDFSSPLFGTEADMLSAYANGQYTYTATLPDTSQQSGTLTDNVRMYAPDPAAITNVSDFGSYDSSQDFSINFTSFTKDANADTAATFVRIGDASGNVLYANEFLDASTTSVTIGAGTLAADTDYTVEIIDDNRIINQGSGFGGLADGNLIYDVRTDFNFHTLPVPEPATLAALSIGGLMFFRRRSRR